VAIGIGHVEISFTPGGVARPFWIKSSFFQMNPESVHIRDVENQPTPASHPVALFQKDRRLFVFSSRSEEKPASSPPFFSIVGGIRHEFTSATLESSFRTAYGERQRR
jgi:hypothetical protein